MSQPILRVLSIAGHDPGGGAGIQAEIEAIAAAGCLAATAITCLTVQDSCGVQRLVPTAPDLVEAQVRAALRDGQVAAIKIGLLGAPETGRWLAQFLSEFAAIPVVLDPIVSAGSGDQLATDELVGVIRHQLLAKATIATPNSPEARRLAGEQDLPGCARAFAALGCRYTLITGTHEREPLVHNRLYRAEELVEDYRWERLPGSFHGSGCTLSAAIAARLALGHTPEQAVRDAQQYTWESLRRSRFSGRCQALPQRLGWTTEGPLR